MFRRLDGWTERIIVSITVLRGPFGLRPKNVLRVTRNRLRPRSILPQSVIKRTDFHGEEQLALDYNAVVGLLVEAVKDLDSRLKKCNCNCIKE